MMLLPGDAATHHVRCLWRNQGLTTAPFRIGNTPFARDAESRFLSIPIPEETGDNRRKLDDGNP